MNGSPAAACVAGNAKDRDVLFVFPAPGRGFGNHLQSAYARAYLEARGIRTGQFVHSGNEPWERVAETIAQSGPRILAFWCTDANYPQVRPIAAWVRRLDAAIAIACTGPAATFSDRVILDDCPAVDYCLRYDVESALLELIESLDGKRRLASVRGIAYRWSRTEERKPSSASLDEYPDPYLEGLLPANEAPRIGLLTSQGCPYSCTFCERHAMSRGKVRFHSVERVISVLSYLERQLEDAQIAFVDDNLALDPARFHLLLEAMARLRLRNIRFRGMMRPESLSEGAFRLLREAGFFRVHFGLESGAPHILADVRKAPGREAAFLEHVDWAVRKAKEAGLETSISIILGCPGESEAEGRKTLDYLRRLDVDRYCHYSMEVRAGTELASACEDFGIRTEAGPLSPLPRRTRPAYPAHRLPMLDNAECWPARQTREMSMAMRLLTGTQAENQDGGLGPTVAMLPPVAAGPIIEWLNLEQPCNSSICVIDEQDALDGAPFEVFRLRAVPDSGQCFTWRLNELGADAPDANTAAIRVMPLSALDWSRLPEQVDTLRETLLVTVETGSDIEALEAVVAAGEPAGQWTLPGAVVETCVSIADSCRWAGQCPASGSMRWFADAEGNLLPCRRAAPVGRAGEKLETIRQRVNRLHAAVAEERGCAACPMSGACSRCLFTGPIETGRFCEFRRRHRDLSALVNGLVLARLLSHADAVPEHSGGITIQALRDRLHGEFDVGGQRIALSECLLLEFEGADCGFLSHSRNGLLVPLPADQVQLIKDLAHAAEAQNRGGGTEVPRGLKPAPQRR